MDKHPNGKPIKKDLRPLKRDDGPFYEDIFPDDYIGKLLKGILVEFLIKQEHRIGWARKAAYGDSVLDVHPNETVASHQWGVAALIMAITRESNFQEEFPNFDRLKALEMALIHDVAELRTGDITPSDGISQEEKHKAESIAMDVILGCFPDSVGRSLHSVYYAYEDRICPESKFVKDCDKLDFILHAFLLERQGFTGFSEFYSNTIEQGFSSKIAMNLAKTLSDVRNSLFDKGLLYKCDS